MKTRLLVFLLLPVIANAAPARFGAQGTAGGQGAAGNAAEPGTQLCDGTGNGPGAGLGMRAGTGPAQRRGGGAGLCQQQGTCPLTTITPVVPTTLPGAELIYAVEEERVARDLYLTAAERWSLRVFERIARSEAQHEAAVTQLAGSVAVTLPVAARGVYATPELQKLYTDSLVLVNESEVAALRVGALVEESDIAELRRLAGVATDDGTRAVLAHMEQASTRHLNAFVRSLARFGESYQPQVLAVEDFVALIVPRG
ncbi:ferritin-like domain-containing protein [Opitutus terrae]|nr:DUF2202 domain-containing protein [Opitutus terrae]